MRIVGAGDFGSATNCERMKSGWSLGIKADCTIHFNSTVCGATPMAFGVLGCSQTNTVMNNKKMQAHYAFSLRYVHAYTHTCTGHQKMQDGTAAHPNTHKCGTPHIWSP